MRYVPTLIAITAAAAMAPHAQAQPRQRQVTPAQASHGSGLALRVTPRSFLDPVPVVPVGSINPGYTGYGQAQSYLAFQPYGQNRERFGLSHVLPDPVTNGPYVGARNPFGPIDYVAPPGLAR
jgi:hypothetical protein